jgi:ABC-type spermidine/putrescine transport system permease subunit II
MDNNAVAVKGEEVFSYSSRWYGMLWYRHDQKESLLYNIAIAIAIAIVTIM